jgi:hypothetical protein
MKETISVSEIETGRLKVLAEHLRKGKLFEKVDSTQSSFPKVHHTGWFVHHYVFPFCECARIFKEWEFSNDGRPKLKELSQSDAAASAMAFFKVDEYVFQHLFSPSGQDCYMFGGKVLPGNATGRHIAHNIDCFLKKLETFQCS